MAYGQTKTAIIKVTTEVARETIDDKGKIRICMVNCTIRVVTIRFPKYYKCWHTKHLVKAGYGYKVQDCNNEAHCALCYETKRRKPLTT